RPSIDSIQEARAITLLPSAEYGRNMGGLYSVITKSGTNEFHGSAYEYFRNNHLDARNAFSATASPFFLQNQFGASLGGPIRKDKLFFFANFERLINPFAGNANLSVPSPAFRQGDFRGGQSIYDPASTRPDLTNPGQFVRDAFPGNQ